MDSVFDDFGAFGGPSIPSLVAFDQNGLKITYDFEKNPSDSKTLTVNMKAFNTNNDSITDFLFQAAVPKVSLDQSNQNKNLSGFFAIQSFQLQLLPPSSSVIPPNGTGQVSQVIKVTNPNKVICSFVGIQAT